MEQARLQRTQLLLGKAFVERAGEMRVIIFGVGGVGSWCAESLVRSGIRHLTIVDNDTVNVTNCNRQLVATSSTIGRVKVEVLRERLLDINPNADIVAIADIYDEQTAERYHLETYDYVIDAIDSLRCKAHLIQHATRLSKQIRQGKLQGDGVVERLTLFSSMGAALRMDPTKIRVAEFWKVTNDSLARALRTRFKKEKHLPSVKFQCVYSEEPPMANRGEGDPDDTCAYKAQINGTTSHVTAIFGFTIAGLVIQDIDMLTRCE